MSVFTPLEHAELAAFLEPYGLGRLLQFQGIAAGTENSNFFVSLEAGEYVLTLIERGVDNDLGFFIRLLERLHQAGLAVPYAVPTIDGIQLRELAGKPALLQPRLAGKHVLQPNNHQCAEVGSWLARLHHTTQPDIIERPSDRGLHWMLAEGPSLALHLEEPALSLLRDSLNEIKQIQTQIAQLPRANLHADLFRDNVLFEGAHLTGVIDFYNACSGPMLYDVAIAVNDWCLCADGALDLSRGRALLGAYAARRPFHANEAELWPAMLRIACVRFWMSRLIAAEQSSGPDVLVKNPQELYQRLAQRQQVRLSLPLAL